MKSETASKYFGLVVRKECWRLSWRGWVAAMSAILFAGTLWMVNIHPFLAVTQRENTKILVVEGWTSEAGVSAAVEEFRSGQYDQLITTGGPVEGFGSTASVRDTLAFRSADLIRGAGVPAGKIQVVPAFFVGRDRTYNSAVALRHWLQMHEPDVRCFNVLTRGPHARRTWLLFQEAFGHDIKVGIVSAVNHDYDARRWWRYSEGVREILGESIAYLYAKFLFWPSAAER